MLKIRIEKSFKKDIEKIKKSGKYDLGVIGEIKEIVNTLQNQQSVNSIYKRYFLIGELKDYEAIHIKNDLVMVFKVTEEYLILVMIDKHTKVYKKFKWPHYKR